MLEIINLYLKNEGFIDDGENNGKYCKYSNIKEGIDIFIDRSRCSFQLNSEKMSVSVVNCELDQIFDIVDKVLEDPWKYQKHLFRNYLDCVDYFDEHYDKELVGFGLRKNPCIQTADNHRDNIRFRTKLELKYEYSYYHYIWFPYHPGIESIITYLDHDDVEYIDMMRVKDENVIKKIIMYYPEITHLVDGGTKDRYLEFEEYRKELRDGYDEKTVYVDEFIKKYPIEWLGDIKCIGKRITIV